MNVSQYLKHANLSPEAFGALVGHHGTTVRRWLEGGDVKASDIKRMVAVSKRLITIEAVIKAVKRAA